MSSFALVFTVVACVALACVLAVTIHGVVSLTKDGEPDRHDRERVRSARPPGRARREKDRRHLELLPADATVTFAAERSAADAGGVRAALDTELVGLVPVKRKVQEIAALLLVGQRP